MCLHFLIARQILGQYMALRADELSGSCVIELGAGIGICGMLAARLFARQVLLTDVAPEVVCSARFGLAQRLLECSQLDLLPRNIALNGLSAQCQVQRLEWGSEAEVSAVATAVPPPPQRLTVIASDVIYAREALQPLMRTAAALLRSSDDVFLYAFSLPIPVLSIDIVRPSVRPFFFFSYHGVTALRLCNHRIRLDPLLDLFYSALEEYSFIFLSLALFTLLLFLGYGYLQERSQNFVREASDNRSWVNRLLGNWKDIFPRRIRSRAYFENSNLRVMVLPRNRNPQRSGDDVPVREVFHYNRIPRL
jgi:predicted nicotinamide N-methyase